ncbi:MAG: cytochrome d ubiquinol oxidase subunit II [Nitrospirales bacterium]
MNLIPIFLVRYQFHLKPWVFGPFETFKNTWVLLVLGSCSFLARIVSLRTNQFQLARVSAIGYVLTYIWGWGSAQYPYLIKPDLAIYNTAASPSPLALLLSALVAVIIVVFPSLWYLFRMFKISA